jgi:outer membrane protein insertion porin family
MLRKLLISLLFIIIIAPLGAADTTSLEQWWVGKPIEQFIYVDLDKVDPSIIDDMVNPLVNSRYSQHAIDDLQKKLMSTDVFLSVDLIPALADKERTKTIVYIEFVEKQQVSSILIKGNDFISDTQILNVINIDVGTMFSTTQIDRSVSAIKRLYQSKGYDKVDVIPTYATSSSGDGIVLSYEIKEYEWYEQKSIKGFTYSGLKNVPQSKIDDLLYPYINRTFSDELYKEIEKTLQNLDQFSIFKGEAVRGGANNNELYLHVSFTELPIITSIEFVGNSGIKAKILEETADVRKDSFLSSPTIHSARQRLLDLYLERGYADVKVDSSYTVDDETNLLQLEFTIHEGPQVKVREIEFVGTKGVSSSTLRKEISTKIQSLFNSGNYNKEKVREDALSIVMAYQKRGYIDAKVLDVETEELASDDEHIRRLKITFIIEEGEQWYFGGLRTEGNTIYSDQEIASLLYMKPGTVLDITKVQSEIGKIADLYWNEGYVENTIDIQEERVSDNNHIYYTVLIGERGQARVEQVIINGLTKTKPYVLERELEIKAGDIFSKDAYVRSARNLYNTGLLVNVEPEISYGSQDESLVVTYNVEEGNQMNIGFGATFGGNVEGFPVSGFLSWSDTNVGGTGRDLEIMTELSPSSQTATISFKDSWVGDKRWSNGVNLSFNRSTYTNGRQLGDHSPTTEVSTNTQAYPYPYTSYEQWNSAGQPTPDAEFLMPYTYFKISLGYSTGYTFMFPSGRLSLSAGPSVTLNRVLYDADVYRPYDYVIEQYQKAWQFSNRLGLGITWDGRDYIQEPTKGYVLSQNFTYAGGVLGGLSNYMRSSTSGSAFLKVFEIPGEKPTPGVISLNTTVSFMFDQFFPQGDWFTNWTKGISASRYEYLYIDGITMARGINQPEFYQEFLWDSSLELSIQLAQNVLWGEVFVSATGGSTDLTSVGVDPLNWYFSAGFGIRLQVPGFPLGLYMVKTATKLHDQEFKWDRGPFFHTTGDTGLKLVLAITQNIY